MAQEPEVKTEVVEKTTEVVDKEKLATTEGKLLKASNELIEANKKLDELGLVKSDFIKRNEVVTEQDKTIKELEDKILKLQDTKIDLKKEIKVEDKEKTKPETKVEPEVKVETEAKKSELEQAKAILEKELESKYENQLADFDAKLKALLEKSTADDVEKLETKAKLEQEKLINSLRAVVKGKTVDSAFEDIKNRAISAKPVFNTELDKFVVGEVTLDSWLDKQLETATHWQPSSASGNALGGKTPVVGGTKATSFLDIVKNTK